MSKINRRYSKLDTHASIPTLILEVTFFLYTINHIPEYTHNVYTYWDITINVQNTYHMYIDCDVHMCTQYRCTKNVHNLYNMYIYMYIMCTQ